MICIIGFEDFCKNNDTIIYKEPVILIEIKNVIILDEINRCNLSKVFGELITLVEDSKRENLFTTLPSGEQFH